MKMDAKGIIFSVVFSW